MIADIKFKKAAHIGLVAFFILGLALPSAFAEKVEKMSKEELKKIMDQPDTVVLDVRSGRDWTSSEFKIAGAHRADPSKFDQWSDKYAKDKTLVLYCA